MFFCILFCLEKVFIQVFLWLTFFHIYCLKRSREFYFQLCENYKVVHDVIYNKLKLISEEFEFMLASNVNLTQKLNISNKTCNKTNDELKARIKKFEALTLENNEVKQV